MKEKVAKAGYNCKEVTGHRDYPGSPFYRKIQKDCVFLTPGKTAVCDKIYYPDNHAALCYCDCKYSYFILLYKLQDFSRVNPGNVILFIVIMFPDPNPPSLMTTAESVTPSQQMTDAQSTSEVTTVDNVEGNSKTGVIVTISKMSIIVEFENQNLIFNNNFFIDYYHGSVGGVCTDAIHVIRSQLECTAALEKFGYKTSGKFWKGKYSKIPAGCSIRDGKDYLPHWENSTTGVGIGRKDLIPICKESESSGIFHYCIFLMLLNLLWLHTN